MNEIICVTGSNLWKLQGTGDPLFETIVSFKNGFGGGASIYILQISPQLGYLKRQYWSKRYYLLHSKQFLTCAFSFKFTHDGDGKIVNILMYNRFLIAGIFKL